MKDTILNGIDAIAEEAIAAKATPGCVVTVLRKGKLVFQKGYGRLSYTSLTPATPATIYDLASVTKISATNVSVMKLVEEGKLDVKAPIGNYLPWLKGSDKENLLVENLLMHQAGLNPFIPFYKEVIDKKGAPYPEIFSNYKHDSFTTTVTDALYLRSDWPDTMYQRIKTSKLITGE
eukprot:gene3545-4839_t